jgi:6-phosphogluconolactonase
VGPNPSFLALHPTDRFLYAVNEVNELDGQAGGGVTACAYHPFTGRLSVLNTQSSLGTGPCHVAVESGGRYVLAANYMGGSVCMLPITPEGALEPASDLVQHVGSGPDPKRQNEPTPTR